MNGNLFDIVIERKKEKRFCRCHPHCGRGSNLAGPPNRFMLEKEPSGDEGLLRLSDQQERTKSKSCRLTLKSCEYGGAFSALLCWELFRSVNG